LSRDVPAQQVAAIVRRGAGTPEFLEALAEALPDGEPDGGDPLAMLPQSLQSHLTARLDGLALGAGARQTLEAAAVLGASPARAWREVDLPLAARALLVAAAFAFSISLGEFGATAILARPERPTVPVAIYRFLGLPGALNYGQALALSTILMAVTAASILLIERLRVADVGEF
jgi:hypothetical protein